MRPIKIAAVLAGLVCLMSLSIGFVAAQDSGNGDSAITPTLIPSITVTFTPLPTTTPTPVVEHLVRPGENLYRIALRYGTTITAIAQENGITNPALIRSGAVLRIPGVVATPTPIPVTPATLAPTPVPPPTVTYTVRPGDTLFRIAINNRTTVSQLVALNSIANSNVIYVGQTLRLPGDGQNVTTTVPVETAGTGVSTQGAGYGRGIEVYLAGQDMNTLVNDLQDLGVSWVKVRVDWRDYEAAKGEIDFSMLDNVVETLDANQFNILMTVSKAPDWARSSTAESGPPDDMADFDAFMDVLARQYAGRVDAYEIWDEPNLRREWNSSVYSISAKAYAEMLRGAYTTVKAADPQALVISAGLAPTGFNDGVNAVNDRVFLQGLYTEGLADMSDGVGTHPNGWANPPDSLCCAAPVGVETHYEDPSFYFLSTLNDYRRIMTENQDGSTALWVTKFGWGSSEDTAPPPDSMVYVTYTSLGEQGIYDARGFELGAELGFVGPMFLYNLNGCQVQADGAETCYYSLLGPNAAPRPAYNGVQELRQDAVTTPNITEPTPELLPTAEMQAVQPPTAESLPFDEPEATAEASS
ncbi:MAG: LysM peptidoglycan-binding domain-containing protein [Anaerolineaceae bacterium]|nr:LysM peptidoglycan-binding domain-containing protein [Anaerolineaceae bacterium]